MSKDYNEISKEIYLLKKEVENVSNKVDLVLEILNNFTLMVFENEDDDEDEEDYEGYDSDETWVPDEDEWKSSNDDDY